MKVKDLKKQLGIENVYFLDMAVSHLVMEYRIKHKLTQKDLADKIGTKQESIARLESGYLPSLTFLERIAKGMGYDVIVSFKKNKS